MRAKYTGRLKCGHNVTAGEEIANLPELGWMCVPCLLNIVAPPEEPPPPPDGERLLEDPRIRALLCRALVTDSEDEALTALHLARKHHHAASLAR